VSLELGGNAACIVDNEYSDLDYAADRIAFGAFYQSGQSCISVQRVLIHDSHYDKMKEKLIDRASKVCDVYSVTSYQFNALHFYSYSSIELTFGVVKEGRSTR
jgi:acyl-CoA reductase-like NAD-dependent aldehyde dehydrogenase